MKAWNRVPIGLMLLLASSSFSNEVHAAGLEKSVFWSGRYTALAGAAQSSVVGPEALYWNPAGLGGAPGLQVSANFSPTLSKFSGPFGLSSTPQDSNASFSPLSGGFVSYGIMPQLGVGAGLYVSAANKAEYDSVSLGLQNTLGTTYAPPFIGNLTLLEAALGGGYEIVDGLRVGAAWRVAFASGELSFATVRSSNLVGIQAQNLSQTIWSGVRIGAEWNPKNSPFGFGVTWRNRIDLNLEGTANVTIANAASPSGTQPVSGRSVNANANLPMRIDMAAHYDFNADWTGFLGYSFTQYSDEDRIALTGFPTAVIPTGEVDLPLGWTNMQNGRAALQYKIAEDFRLRAGYVFTSQVSSKAKASPIIAAPGSGHTATLGMGIQAMRTLWVDGALEYSWDSGTVATSDIPSGSATAPGDYTARAYAIHLGVTTTF